MPSLYIQNSKLPKTPKPSSLVYYLRKLPHYSSNIQFLSWLNCHLEGIKASGMKRKHWSSLWSMPLSKNLKFSGLNIHNIDTCGRRSTSGMNCKHFKNGKLKNIAKPFVSHGRETLR